MSTQSLQIAEGYYAAMQAKDFTAMAKYLHTSVYFNGPFAKIQGKEAVLEAGKQFAKLFNTLTLRAKFSSEQQAMFVYDLDFPAPIGKVATAALLSIHDGLISTIEIILDARAFSQT